MCGSLCCSVVVPSFVISLMSDDEEQGSNRGGGVSCMSAEHAFLATPPNRNSHLMFCWIPLLRNANDYEYLCTSSRHVMFPMALLENPSLIRLDRKEEGRDSIRLHNPMNAHLAAA